MLVQRHLGGGFYEAGNRFATLTMRWNGSQWVVVPSPNPRVGQGEGKGGAPREGRFTPDGDFPDPPPTPGNMLLEVTAAAPDEIWAVGSSDQNGDTETNTLDLRWNGSQWSVAPSENPSGLGGYNRLYGVDAPGGMMLGCGTYFVPSNRFNTLIERYNGQSCATPTPVTLRAPDTVRRQTYRAIIPSADGPSALNEFYDVAVVGPNDIWAVGRYYPCFGCGDAALIEHWDGNSWTILPNTVNAGRLEDLSVISANDIWAVGNGGGNPNNAVTAHWDGNRWTRVDIGTYGSGDSLPASPWPQRCVGGRL